SLLRLVSVCSQLVSNSWQTVADHVKDTQYTVRELRPNTVYVFIIRAMNAQGVGDPSAMSEPVRTQGNIHSTHLAWGYTYALIP
ncbi:roundabout homolog 2 isoform X1, partial [Tachysurus ichikawai]